MPVSEIGARRTRLTARGYRGLGGCRTSGQPHWQGWGYVRSERREGEGEVGLHLQQRLEGVVHVPGDAGLEFGNAGLHVLKRFRLRPLVLKRTPRVFGTRIRQKAQGSGRARPNLQDKAILWPLNHGFFPFRFEEIPDSVSLPQQLLSAR